MDPKCRSEQSTVIFDPLHKHWHFLGQDEEEDVQHRTRTRQVAVHWSWWCQPILSDLLPQGHFVLKGLWGPLSSPLSYEFITNPLGIRLFIETTLQWLCMPAKKEKIIKYHVYCLCILKYVSIRKETKLPFSLNKHMERIQYEDGFALTSPESNKENYKC